MPLEGLGVEAVVGIHGRADAGPDPELRIGHRERRLQQLGDAAADRGRGVGAVDARLELDQHHELVPAVAGQQVGRAPYTVEATREMVQELISGGMTETVVHELEIVEVD